MNHRAIWFVCALLVLLSCGCQQCQVGRVKHLPDTPDKPAEAEDPKPGNALAELAGNRFDWWTFNNSPRIYMPLTSKEP